MIDGVAVFASLGVTLPVRVDPSFPGSIVDADDRDVLVVDHNAERHDDEVAALAALIVRCVNAAEFSA